MHPTLISIFHKIYPVKEEPIAKRDRPVEVLCLGISRSGTDSLRNALLELGYFDVHHGYRLLERPGETLQWLRLAHYKNTGQTQYINTAEFDKCLGDCEAVTDIASAFAHELLTVYPDAKVVLNYRLDVDAWHKSVKKTIGALETSWLAIFACYFQPVMFWQRQLILNVWTRSHGGNFERDGKQWYRQHYESLEKRLNDEKSTYLKWKVQDGWAPLCEYLEKPVPNTDFPSGNNAATFQARIDKMNNSRLIEAGRNFLLTLAVIVGFSAWVYVKFCQVVQDEAHLLEPRPQSWC